jgi:hypothetical protein
MLTLKQQHRLSEGDEGHVPRTVIRNEHSLTTGGTHDSKPAQGQN